MPAALYGQKPFCEAFSVVLAHALYLPSAGLFALLPLAGQLGRTGSEAVGCAIDYDEASKSVVVTCPRALRCAAVAGGGGKGPGLGKGCVHSDRGASITGERIQRPV